MAGSFETSPNESQQHHRPLQIAALRDGLFATAKELVDDLPKWELVSEDEEAGVLTCRRANGMLGGTSTITITLSAPEGIPSTTVNLRSVTEGGMLSRDKANVAEFLKLYDRRTTAS